MSATSLIEAERKFGRALDELRNKYRGVFASWLNSALADNQRATWNGIEKQIALLRGHFVDEFISTSAPALLDDLNPGAKQDIIGQLRQFVPRNERQPWLDLPPRVDKQWRPGVLRTMAGAAIGAAAALLLFALQAGPAGEIAASGRPAQAVQQPAATPAPQPNAGSPVQSPGSAANPATPAAPVATPQTPPPASAPGGRPEPTEQGALRIIVGALGAALGALVVVCPPLRAMFAGLGFGRRTVGFAGTYGIAFVLLRRIAVAAAVAAILIVAAGLLGLIFIGPKPVWSVLFGLAAIIAIVVARYGIPASTDGGAEAMRAPAIDAFDRQLTIAADVWSALSAALTVRSSTTVRGDPALDKIRSFIVERRDRQDPAETILRLVEQELRLPPGGAADTTQASEFKWLPQSADYYDAVEIVSAGDTVTVLEPPRMTKDAQGKAVVFEKGKVMRKPKGA